MKVIVTGSTGRVGSAVLQSCIQNPAVTSICAITRRPLDLLDPKLNNIVSKDFTNYDDAILEQLKGARACIWALGAPTSGKEVHVDYVFAAINAIQKSIVPQLNKGDKFRFVLTSGGAVPILDSSALFFLGGWRKMRADVDRSVLAVETKNPGTWESYVVRPWLVADEPARLMPYILRPELGAAMVDLAVNGGTDRMVANAELRTSGQAAMSRYKL